jgi:hypothetical protein
MATTTNYSWSTPDDTALVKDGAAAIRTLGSSADTTVKALNPGTTAGDIDYYTTSTAKARIAIGTAGQLLAVNSGATAPEWVNAPAGGSLTLLSTTTLSGASTTISSISGSYKHLYFEMSGLTNNTSNGTPRFVFNVTDISRNRITESNVSSTFSAANIALGNGAQQWLRTGGLNYTNMTIFDYASTANRKTFELYTAWDGASDTDRFVSSFGSFNANTAINSIKIEMEGGETLSAGTVKVYGVN